MAAPAVGGGAPAFTDPLVTVPMEDGWSGRGIAYKDAAPGTELSVLVNQQVAPVLMDLVQGYANKKSLSIQSAIGTCGISSGALSRKEVDVASFCCPPGEVDRLPGLEFHTVGITPLLILVHKDNPVRNVTLQQARALFSGGITNWSELGGPDQVVRPLGMLHCKKRPGHWRLILPDADSFSPLFHVTGDIEDTISMVAATPAGVGFEIMMNVRHFGYEGKARPLMIDGHDPMDLGRLVNGKYPFYRAITFTSWKDESVANPNAAGFVGFVEQEVGKLPPSAGVASSAALRKAGWKFSGNELVAGP